jgi:carbohydrate diacid regulator
VDVVRTRRPASHTAEQAAALRGVRPGLTLPLLLVDGDAVGTVGITGSPTRIQRFGPGSCTSSS